MSVPTAYLGVILIWSTTPLAIQWSAQGASFSFAVMARMLIGLAICLVLLFATRTAFPLTPAARRLYAISGLSLFVAMLLTYWGALHIPSGLISVIFGLSPLVTGVFAALWLSERTLTPIPIAGLGLALAGLWVIFGQPWPGDSQATLGTAAVVAGMTVQALGLVWIKRLNVHASSLAITTGSLGVATPLFVMAWLVADAARLPPEITPRATMAIVYLGVFGSVVGFTLYYYVIRHLDAGRVALIMLVTPVAALLLGQALNAEFIPGRSWFGIGLIGMGLLLYEWPALRLLRNRTGSA
jgi:drug/metabolite transporter (DMT)-like permease